MQRQVNFDRTAAARNVQVAQRAQFVAATKEQFAKARHAANVRLSVIAGAVFGVAFCVADLFI